MGVRETCVCETWILGSRGLWLQDLGMRVRTMRSKEDEMWEGVGCEGMRTLRTVEERVL